MHLNQMLLLSECLAFASQIIREIISASDLAILSSVECTCLIWDTINTVKQVTRGAQSFNFIATVEGAQNAISKSKKSQKKGSLWAEAKQRANLSWHFYI